MEKSDSKPWVIVLNRWNLISTTYQSRAPQLTTNSMWTLEACQYSSSLSLWRHGTPYHSQLWNLYLGQGLTDSEVHSDRKISIDACVHGLGTILILNYTTGFTSTYSIRSVSTHPLTVIEVHPSMGTCYNYICLY